MTIYLFNAVYLFYSRIIFKKLDDSARILFRKVEKTFKNAAKTISRPLPIIVLQISTVY